MDVSTLLADPVAIELEHFVSQPNSINLVVHSVQSQPSCPRCGHPSASLHSHYQRAVADLPWHGVAIKLVLHTRKFRCRNELCPQKVFCERLPKVVEAYARKTVRLNVALRLLAFALGGEAGARTACGLGLAVSGDTLLRRIRRTPAISSATPRVLGVDDWAKRKGKSYGTILVDLERRRPIDLLPDREAATLAAALKTHPGIEIITRDRSPTYAAGINEGAPQALQVADRWHLLRNLGQAAQDLMTRRHRFVKQACTVTEAGGQTCDGVEKLLSQINTLRPTSAQRRSAASRQRGYDLYQQIKQLAEAGVSINAIAKALGIHWRTAHKYAKADCFQERAKRRRGATVIDAYVPYLRQRWEEGCHRLKQLLDEIKAKGYQHKMTPLWRLTARWRAQGKGQPPCKRLPPDVQMLPPPIGPRVAAWRFQQCDQELKEEEALYVARLCELCPEIGKARKLCQAFIGMVRERKAEALDLWLEEAANSEVVELKRFAKSLKQDYKAVRAGLSEAWSQGQVEGQVNKLKLVKRQMFGRAKFDLLRMRVLHSV